MPIEFHCHVCGRLLRTSEDKAGRTAKCPGCGEAVAVPFPAKETADELVFDEPDEESATEEDGIDNAHDDSAAEAAPLIVSRRRSGSKICPVCGETIKAVAVRCRFCGEDVAEVEQLPQSLEFGEVFTASWKLFSDDLGLHIGAMLIVGLINLVVVGIGVVIGVVTTAAIAGGGGAPALAVIVLIVVVTVVLLVATAVQAYLTAGYNIFLLKSVRGERPEISDLFSGGPYFLRMLANLIVFNVLVTGGMLLCYVPGVLLLLMLWPYSFVLVDEDRPGLESLRRAKELMAGNWGPVFVLMLVWGLVCYGAANICPIAGLFAYPWMMVMQATIYCRLTGQITAER
jgi:phage FluMu protein Com